jgi:hypothetical protein
VVGPPQDLTIDRLEGSRWDLALQLLETGEGAVNLRGLVLRVDQATPKSGRRMHIEFECPIDPSQVGRAQHERLAHAAERDLQAARETIGLACRADERFAALVSDSGLVYEYVHRYGMGALLVATAGQSGEMSWR